MAHSVAQVAVNVCRQLDSLSYVSIWFAVYDIRSQEDSYNVRLVSNLVVKTMPASRGVSNPSKQPPRQPRSDIRTSSTAISHTRCGAQYTSIKIYPYSTLFYQQHISTTATTTTTTTTTTSTTSTTTRTTSNRTTTTTTNGGGGGGGPGGGGGGGGGGGDGGGGADTGAGAGAGGPGAGGTSSRSTTTSIT